MQVPATWVKNTQANNNRRVYDSGSVVYDSGSLTFDGITAGQSQITNEIPIVWVNKSNASLGSAWEANPSAYANIDPYDTSAIYDETGNYDSVVAGQSFLNTKKPTAWSNV